MELAEQPTQVVEVVEPSAYADQDVSESSEEHWLMERCTPESGQAVEDVADPERERERAACADRSEALPDGRPS